jgi:hypothetical protein
MCKYSVEGNELKITPKAALYQRSGSFGGKTLVSASLLAARIFLLGIVSSNSVHSKSCKMNGADKSIF